MIPEPVETPSDLDDLTRWFGQVPMTVLLVAFSWLVVLVLCVVGVCRGFRHGCRVWWAMLRRVWTTERAV